MYFLLINQPQTENMIKKISLLALAVLLVFLFFRFKALGVFTKIENNFDGQTVKIFDKHGAEDIQISHIDSFALVSSTNRQVYPPVRNEAGGLYRVELKSGEFKIKTLKSAIPTPFSPHGISMVKVDDYYRVLAVNNKMGPQTIEEFKFVNDSLIYVKTHSDSSMISPNDVLAIDRNSFYWTNDHKYTKGIKRFFEGFLALKISTVYHFDGKNYNKEVDDIAFSNGIIYDRNRNLIYVASSTGFLVKVYEPKSDGSLNFIEDIPVGTGVDNVALDEDGNIWVAGHPKLLTLHSYEAAKDKKISPSEIVKVTYKSLNDYTIEKIYVNDGSLMSASTVAAPFGNHILTGNLMDNKFLLLRQKKNK